LGETIVGETTRGEMLDRLPDEIWGMIQGILAEDTNSMGLMGVFEPVRGRARGKLPLKQTWRDAVFDGLILDTRDAANGFVTLNVPRELRLIFRGLQDRYTLATERGGNLNVVSEIINGVGIHGKWDKGEAKHSQSVDPTPLKDMLDVPMEPPRAFAMRMMEQLNNPTHGHLGRDFMRHADNGLGVYAATGLTVIQSRKTISRRNRARITLAYAPRLGGLFVHVLWA
jgi:hypothetical protein